MLKKSKVFTLNFCYLPAYAAFILKNILGEFVEEQIKLAHELDLPILKYYAHLSHEDLVQLSTITTSELLQYLADNAAEEQIKSAVERWRNNQLPTVEKDQIVAEDITLINYLRKQVLVHFLPSYTNEHAIIMATIKEIDQFIASAETASINTFSKLMEDRINEQAMFVKKINNTSPGLIFVYDLEVRQIVYSNWKTKDILGYDTEEIKNYNNGFLNTLQHPDDVSMFNNHFQDFTNTSENDITTITYRLLHKDGNYRYIKNFESIFRRNEEGVPKQIIGICLDVDAEINISKQLINSEELLLQAQQLSGIGSFEWDLSTSVGSATPQIFEILQLEKLDDFNNFADYIHAADKDRVMSIINKAKNERTIYDYECRYITQSGEKTIWVKGDVNEKYIVKGTIMDVTERNKLLNKLQESEILYKEAQALAHFGNWSWDIPNNKIMWSDELFRIYDLPPQSEEITFEKFTAFIHPDDKETRIQQIKNELKNPGPSEYYFRIILRNKVNKLLHGKSEVKTDKNGNPVLMIGTVQDVTEQKLIEKELQDNQNFIIKVADATPSIISTYNLKSNQYTYISQGLNKLLGYQPNELFEGGLAFFKSLIHPDDLAIYDAKHIIEIEAQNSKGNDNTVIEYNYRVKHQDGTYRWLNTYETVFDRNNKGNIESILNISVDITDQLQTESRLAEQEHFIKHIAEASPTILYLFDLEERCFKYINREVKEVMGYEPEEIMELGTNSAKYFIHPEDDIKAPDKYVKYTHSGGSTIMHQFEGRVKHKNNKWKWILTREIVFKRNDNGKAIQVLGSALDITERKEMEQALKYKTIQLEQSNSSLEEFAHIASHDLQEPLRKISTFGDRLMSSNHANLTADGLRYLDKIIVSTKRMQLLISDILSISLLSGEKVFEQYDLNKLVEEVLQTLEYKIDSTQAKINTSSLPAINIIPSQFRQLFQNLISNSLKFSRPGIITEINIKSEVIPKSEVIKYKLQNAAEYLKLTFEDNGIGFEDHYADKIFAIFQRLNGRSEYEGTGIGLAICKKIVENHGGIIMAKAIPNKGAIFSVVIPT